MTILPSGLAGARTSAKEAQVGKLGDVIVYMVTCGAQPHAWLYVNLHQVRTGLGLLGRVVNSDNHEEGNITMR